MHDRRKNHLRTGILLSVADEAGGGVGCVNDEVENHQGQQDQADGQEDEDETAPEGDFLLQPVDVFGIVGIRLGMGGFQVSDLIEVLAVIVGDLLL